MADQTIVLKAGDTVTVTVDTTVVAAPTVTEVDVKESDGSEVVTEPVETPAVEAAE